MTTRCPDIFLFSSPASDHGLIAHSTPSISPILSDTTKYTADALFSQLWCSPISSSPPWFSSDHLYISPIVRAGVPQRTPSPKPASTNSSPERPLALLSPLTPLTPDLSPSLSKNLKRKRPDHQIAWNPRPKRTLRSRTAITHFIPPSPSSACSSPSPSRSPSPSPAAPSLPTYTVRTFPDADSAPPISADFPLFYRRFPASSYFLLSPVDSSPAKYLFPTKQPGGIYNPPRRPLDLYTPRFVKGKGHDKVGLCPICIEPPARGGAGRRIWLAMKFSAFKCYHMQYAHGISASTGLPYSPPLAFRVAPRPAAGLRDRTHIKEGRCHRCVRWVALEGVKDVETKVKEIYWWKHAALCHHASTLDTEDDIYEPDAVYAALKALGDQVAV